MLSSTVIAYLLTALAVSATPTRRNNGGGKGQDTTLDGLAQKTKRYIGTATNAFNIQGTNPGGAYVSVLESDFRGALTAENEGKWEVIHPALNTYNFTGMDVVSRDA
jgi:GH35 family endo-1,4-beta-xylanase